MEEDEAAPASAGTNKKLHVVLLPWLAFGHLIPYLELAKRLAARGHTVSFLSTPRNLARLPPVPARLSPLLRLIPLPRPTVEGLPDGAESTADAPPEQNELIKQACDGLAAPFAAFLDSAVAGGMRPDWVFNDFCHHWLPAIAGAHGVPCATFCIVQPSTIAFFGPRWGRVAVTWEDLVAPPAWCGSFLPPDVAFRRHEAEWIATMFQPNASGIADLDRMWRVIDRSRLVIFRGCEEVEPGVFDLLTGIFKTPAVPAGVLFKPPDLDGSDDNSTSSERDEALRWLDDQPPRSVVYVALGSEAPLTAPDLRELALGLELAGVRFLWAFRKPAGTCAPDADAAALLPAGFAARARGLVRTGWVPQARVLAHAAVAAFLTHSGWGSTLESLVLGRPMVMLPFVVDQPIVARTMARRGVGVEVARAEGGAVGRDAVAAAVRRVMAEEDGDAFARNAAEMKEVLGDQRRQDAYVDKLVELLWRYKDTDCCVDEPTAKP